MPRHRSTAEGVADHEVGRVVGEVPGVGAGVARDRLEVVVEHQPEFVLAELEYGAVEFEHDGLRSRPGGGEVAGHRESAAADVDDIDRLGGRRHHAEDSATVLE